MTGRAITDHSSPPDDVGGANPVVLAPGSDALGSRGAVLRARSTSVSGLGAFAAFGAAALCLAFSSKVNSESFTPKFAVALLFAAVGIVPLARLFRAPSAICWAARGAVGFLLVALVSALVSPSPALGIFGLYTWGTGWLLWLAAVGAFAIGASLGPEDRCWLFAGLLVGALGNALVAVYQIVVQPQGGGLVLYDGLQADGLLGNPIHLEALLLGALALVLGRACRSPLRWGAAVMLLAVGLEFTFERFALGILVLLVLYALYSYGLRRGGVFAVLIGIGYGIAYLSGGSGLGQRVTSGSADTTFGIRPRVWLEGAHYLLHHPLLGVGPGQFRTAMDSTATLSFFQNVLAGRILTDGHDIFAEVAVTTGFLGLICFLVWLTGAARMVARCSFLGFGAAMIAVGLVEPMNVAILPLVFLGLGAATAVRMRTHDKPAADASQPESGQLTPNGAVTLNARRASPYAIVTTIVALAIALLLGGTMVVGDAYMFNGTHHALGQPYDIYRLEDFTSEQIARAAAEPGKYSTALVFSTKYDPVSPLFTLGPKSRALDERYFGLHHDLPPEAIAHQLGGTLVWKREDQGQWIALIRFNRQFEAALQVPDPLL